MPKLDKKKAKSTDEAERSFELLEEGIYLGTLQEVTVNPDAPKGEAWSWRFSDLINTETDEKGSGSVWSNTSLSDAAAWKLKEHFDAFEVPPDTDTDELIGKQVQLVITQRTIEKGPRVGELANSVEQLMPLGTEAEGS